MTPALELRGLSKRFGGLTATDDVSLSVPAGSLHALIGPNGAGKTTLINQVAGDLRHDAGAIMLGGIEIGALPAWERVRCGLARTFQIAQLLPHYSVLDNVALAIEVGQGHCFRFFADARKDRQGARSGDVASGGGRAVDAGIVRGVRPRPGRMQATRSRSRAGDPAFSAAA